MVSQELGDLVGNLSAQASRLVSKAVAFIVQAYDNLLAALARMSPARCASTWLNGCGLSRRRGH